MFKTGSLVASRFESCTTIWDSCDFEHKQMIGLLKNEDVCILVHITPCMSALIVTPRCVGYVKLEFLLDEQELPRYPASQYY
jgi:hypothetical protein